jgi:pyruvate dehydrogenase E2 component (dihydrolipoamide acetyltransferase)
LLPDVGEGLIEADIVTWKVRVGDEVTLNQPLVDVETAKAIVELPSPFAGVVTVLHGNEGDTIEVDAPLVTIRTGDVDDAPTASAPETPAREGVLVGFGVSDDNAPVTRRTRRSTLSNPAPVTSPTPTPPVTSPAPVSGPVRTTPPVRLLAKQLGVDLRTVRGTGRAGIITRADVEGRGSKPATQPSTTSGPDQTSRFVGRPLESWNAGPLEERIPMKGLLKTMAATMVASVQESPQAAVWVRLDATGTMEAVARLKNDPALAGVRVSPLTIVAMAFTDAARHYPGINSYVDNATNEVVVQRRVNLGIAADTPRGLVVPNVKSADQLDVRAMAMALTVLVEKARTGTVSPADMAGTTLTITNVGPFGVDAAVPLLPPGTGAILCVGQIAKAPWVVDHAVVVRHVVEIAMTFDHRQIDGALASAVLGHVAQYLRQPPVA